MAFTGDLKYQSVFYNYFKKKVDVQIYKRGYSGAVTQVRTSEVSIEPNFQDENTAVIGTGARVVIIADTTQMTQYEDLLVSLEKEFLCIIQYNNAVVFSGYSICDLNERQFLPFAAITLQFTDYLRRLESYFLPCLSNAGGMSKIMEIVSEALTEIDNDTTLYVNSSLFEEGMSQTTTDDFMSQTYLDNYMFHSDPTTFDNGYEALNKALLSFGAYLYSFKGMWAIERQEDVLRADAWIRFMDILMSLPTADTFTSQKQALNRQAGDFNYVDMSQVVAYESGLKTLILKLQDKQLDSFVFNDYGIDNFLVTDEYLPTSGTLQSRKWYKHTHVVLSNAGFAYRGISSYIKWTYSALLTVPDEIEFAGLYYETEIQFPVTTEEPVILNVDFKQSSGEMVMPPSIEGVTSNARLRFCIRFVGGDLDGYYMYYDPYNPSDLYLSATFTATEALFPISVQTKPVFNMSQSFNLTDQIQHQGGNSSVHASVWDQLGNPIKQKFMIFFFPMEFWVQMPPTGIPAPAPEFHVFPATQILGDIQVTMTQQKILNKLTYYINSNFEKTEEIDINFFDLDNINFVNSPMMLDEGGIYNKTDLWVSTLNTTPVPLMDVFAKNRFQNYARTIHRLKGTILYDGYIKPFAVITDDNLVISDPAAADYGETVKFIVQNYTWNLALGTYDINAQEYTDEDLGFDLSQDTGGGTGQLTVPQNIILTQAVPGGDIGIVWDAVSGATGYIVQRQPYWNAVLNDWSAEWRTISESPALGYYDGIQGEHTPMPATLHLMYRVAAKTDLLYGPYSGSESIIWMAT